MTFISYAQNLEDVMLWRIFKNVKNGFYIDVGAYDPVVESVTKAFYDRGWHGINIEPMYQYFQRLNKERAEDINLPVAVGAEDGLFSSYEIPDTGLSTFDGDIAKYHQQHGWTVVRRTVQVMTLTTICRQYADAPIHFLKVDVEGDEQQVLLGMAFGQYRPWVVLVKARLPLSQKHNCADCEHILRENGYQYVYFDGLNRFYIADEKAAEIKPCFLAPPNCFDEYQRYAEYILQCEKDRLMQENQELALQNQRLQERIYASRAWRSMDRLFPVQAQHAQAAVLAELLREEISLRRAHTAKR